MADMNFVRGKWNIVQSTEDYIDSDYSQKRVDIKRKGNKIHILKGSKKKKKDTYFAEGRSGGVFTKKFLFIPLPVKLFITGIEDQWILIIRKNLLTKRMDIDVMCKDGELSSTELLSIRKIVRDCEDGDKYLKYLRSVNE